jgi:hypothetical protein
MASASIQKRPNGKWRARYRDAAGREHARHFPRKLDAQRLRRYRLTCSVGRTSTRARVWFCSASMPNSGARLNASPNLRAARGDDAASARVSLLRGQAVDLARAERSAGLGEAAVCVAAAIHGQGGTRNRCEHLQGGNPRSAGDILALRRDEAAEGGTAPGGAAVDRTSRGAAGTIPCAGDPGRGIGAATGQGLRACRWIVWTSCGVASGWIVSWFSCRATNRFWLHVRRPSHIGRSRSPGCRRSARRSPGRLSGGGGADPRGRTPRRLAGCAAALCRP